MASSKYWVWLAAQDRLRTSERAALLRHYGDAEAVFFAPKGEHGRVEGLRAEAAKELERQDLSRAVQILDDCERQGLRIVTWQDTDYPARLKNVYEPPLVLYAKGRWRDLDDEAAIAVIGTRQPTPYGCQQARAFSAGIVRCGGVVLSGLGNGLDGEAAKAALEAGGFCVGVLGCAHEASRGWLAREVADWGLLLSEYAPGTTSQKYFFRERNRITAGLSVGVVVVEAPEKSGALLFAAEAVSQGKEVFAVPGELGAPNSVGNLSLLRDGATLATCAWDVMQEFAGRFPEKIRRDDSSASAPASAPKQTPAQEPEKKTKERKAAKEDKKAVDSGTEQAYIDWKEQLDQLNEDQLKIVGVIGSRALHIDDIVEETALSTARVLSQLTVLEIKGYIRRESGRRFALKITKK